jgi:hypothetical protein
LFIFFLDSDVPYGYYHGYYYPIGLIFSGYFADLDKVNLYIEKSLYRKREASLEFIDILSRNYNHETFYRFNFSLNKHMGEQTSPRDK